MVYWSSCEGEKNKFIKAPLQSPTPSPTPSPTSSPTPSPTPSPTLPTPSPTPSPTAVGYPCTKVGDCVQSPDYPNNYGNKQSCELPLSGFVISVSFETERNFGKLFVEGTVY